MASTIVTRVISAVNDNAISMNNSSWARPITLPSTWSKVRFGIRAHFGPTNAVTAGTSWAMGLCSGTASLVGDLNTTNFVGLGCNASWTPSGGQITGPQTAMTKVGAVSTFGGALLNPCYAPANALTTDNFEMFFVDITKGNPNYTIQQFGPSNNGGINPCTQAQFLAQVVNQTPAFVFHTYTAGVAIAASEAAGAFNAVSVWWSDSTVLCEITDHAVVLLA